MRGGKWGMWIGTPRRTQAASHRLSAAHQQPGGTGTQVALAATGGDLSFAVPGKDAAAQLPCHPPRIDHGISLRTINLNR